MKKQKEASSQRLSVYTAGTTGTPPQKEGTATVTVTDIESTL